MDKEALCRAFESASVEVLGCLKELYTENRNLKTQLACNAKISVLSNVTSTSAGSYRSYLDPAKEDIPRDLKLDELLELCTSQSAEICLLRKKLHSAEEKYVSIERELVEKSGEIEMLGNRLQELGYQRQNSSETLVVTCTQTDDTLGEIREYLPVHKNDEVLEDVNLLEYPELNMFKDMFTPRSRIGGLLSNRQIPASDDTGMELISLGYREIS